MKILNQEVGCNIIQSHKTVDWLVENTAVRTFNSVTFEGYQRKVNQNQVKKIKEYLVEREGFYLPTPIICASDDKYTENSKLFIVDGQHRVEAFKELQREENQKYQEIRSKELSIIVLEKPDINLEIDTFITINKTSRKVDTSLALILKNKINRRKLSNEELLSSTKKEFLAVELALAINESENSIWSGRIALEGNPTTRTYQTISLNAFIRSSRLLVHYLEKFGILRIDWDNDTELEKIKYELIDLYLFLWKQIEKKWTKAFADGKVKQYILMGNIGVSSITKYLLLQMNSGLEQPLDKKIEECFAKWIFGLNITEELWKKGNEFSGYSSESGTNYIANKLFNLYQGGQGL